MSELEKVVADAVASARCYPERPDAGKGLDEFIARAVIPIVLEAAAGVADGHADQCEDTAIGRRINSTARDIGTAIRNIGPATITKEK